MLNKQAPTSRIPRPAGLSPALKSGIPTLSGLAVKRKAPSSPIVPAKRVASGSNSTLGQSTTRKASASSGFLPTARKPLTTATASLGRSSIASSSSAGSATRIRTAPVVKRPPASASAGSSTGAVRPAARAGPSRGVSPFSGIGSGVASAAQIKVRLSCLMG